MVYYIILFISFFIIAFIIKHYRSAFYSLAEDSVSLVNDLIANEDDEVKIKHVSTGTNKLVLSLLKMFMVAIAAIAVGSIPIIIYCLITNTGYNELSFLTLYPIIAISAGATVPFVLPSGKGKKKDYSELSILLHHLALDNYNIADKLFKSETRKSIKKNFKPNETFVIVSGLARAGTTSLMNNLAEIDNFISLNYSNMPFLMSPNLWKKLYNPKTSKVKERSHKDGIMIGLNSNEALEEYFFKVKANDSYISKKTLNEYTISESDYNDYLNYQNNIVRNNTKTYLAKNNNFILRYSSMRQYNNSFLMVILYRDPLTHAASLMEKHKEYTKLHNEDKFVLDYMNWLGHHEFGLNQKQFLFNTSEEVVTGDKSLLDYWLKIWINYYSYVLTISHSNTILINYNNFCEDPTAITSKILKKVNIESDITFTPFNNKRKAVSNYTPEVLEEAMRVYEKLGDGF